MSQFPFLKIMVAVSALFLSEVFSLSSKEITHSKGVQKACGCGNFAAYAGNYLIATPWRITSI